MKSVQNYAKDLIVQELEKKLDTDISIGKLKFQPFDAIELDSVFLYDRDKNLILMAEEISAHFDLLHLFKNNLVVSSARISDFSINLCKENKDSALNIQFIIDAFKPKEKNNNSELLVNLNLISIVNGNFNYDVKDKPVVDNKFDVNHIQVSRLNAKFALKSLKSDSLNIQVKKLNLKDRSGLEIKNLTTRLITQGGKAWMKGFRLDLPNSFIELDKCQVNVNAPDSVSNVMDYLNFDCKIAPSHISPKDVSVLVPALHNFKDLITIEAELSGSVDNVLVSNLSLVYGQKSKLKANAEVRGIRNKKKMHLHGRVENLTIERNELEKLVNNLSEKPLKLPAYINELGTIVFEGDLSGYLNQLTAFGKLSTDIGSVKTDILFGFDPDRNIKSYAEGKINSDNLNINKLFGNKDLDDLMFTVGIHYNQPVHGDAKGNVEAVIQNFSYKNHSYKNIKFDTEFKNLKFNSKLTINDPNGKFNLDGLFDFSDKENPLLNFTAKAREIQLDSLHIADSLHQSYLSFDLDVNFKGKNIDDADGFIKIDSLQFSRNDKNFFLKRFLLKTGENENKRYLDIVSDILNGSIRGNYSLMSLGGSLKETVIPYMDVFQKSGYTKRKSIKPQEKTNILNFDFNFNNTTSLSSVLNLPVTIISQAKLTGFYNSLTDKFKLEVFTPSIIASGKSIQSGYFVLENPKDEIKANFSGTLVNNKNTSNNISVKSSLKENTIKTNLSFDADNKQKAKGDFSLLTKLSKTNDKLQVDIDILPGELMLNNIAWKMGNSHICLHGDKSIEINNLSIQSDDGHQGAKINGKYSPNNITDILKIELKNIDLSYVFETLAIDALKFGGLTTGNVLVSSIEGKPYANTRLDVRDFSFNGTELGSLNLFSELDDKTNKVIMEGTILSKENKKTFVSGYVDPVKQGLLIGFDADSIDIGFIGYYASSLFDKVSGKGSGHVTISGNFSRVTVEGDAYIQDGNIGLNFLNTTYSFSDSIHMRKNLIYFNDISFKDQHNNVAKGSGKVVHDHFSDFVYYINLSADNFLLYNASENLNPLFYGKVFGSGNGEISGDMQAINIDIRMRTEKNTSVHMNFMDEEVNEYSFITYKNNINHNDSLPADNIHTAVKPIQSNSGIDINMNFYIDATPEASVEILMDPVGGDVLKGSGSGAIQFVWSTKTSPQLFGNYLINRGNYNFTFQKLMERKFSIEDGSSVQFTGDPFGAMLDVKALYKLTANLNDLDKDLVRNSGQTNIPVNCVLHLTGPLKRPNVGLDIAFPSADPEIERQIKNLINTEDMINKQVAYLLILSKFYTPDYANIESKTSDFAAVASATLSTQLSKIISQIDDRWQVGTNIRYSDAGFTNTEVELVLSSQLLNDRLIINGNFGYREDKNKANNQDNFIGNVDIEYLLNNSGSWRIKAYNHYNEKYYYTETSIQTQGVGLMYKKDFDRISELFRRKRKRKPAPVATGVLYPSVQDTSKTIGYLNGFVKIKQ